MDAETKMAARVSDEAFEIIGPNRSGRWLLTCDHASNRVPNWVNGGDLGLPSADMDRHIAYDIGAAGVTRHLSDLLDSAAVLSNFSRIVIDPNRGALDPTLIRTIYDGSIIPANRSATADELQRRKDTLYAPYHAAIAEVAVSITAPVVCAIHSFTPQLKDKPKRPWEVGVLYAHDDRFARPFIEACEAQGWCVGDNKPYNGELPGDAIDQHALQHGRANVLIEVRNDLIEDAEGQRLWAERLAPILEETLATTGL